MDEDEQQQHRVVELVNQVMHVLAGQNDAEATTALTLAVVCTIVAHAKDDADCRAQAKVFTQQVYDYADRRDIVDWIKAATSYPTPTPERVM